MDPRNRFTPLVFVLRRWHSADTPNGLSHVMVTAGGASFRVVAINPNPGAVVS